MSEATTYEGAPELCGQRFQEWAGDPLWPCLRTKGHEGPHAVQKDLAELFDTRDQRDEAVRQRDELRAILAPLLTSRRDDCLFCGVKTLVGGRMHRSDCPVLRRAILLGRDRAPAHPEGGAT